MSANNSPTTFTDDDLKKLKEYINNDNFAYVDGCPDFLRSHGIVARLEAAEYALEKSGHLNQCYTDETNDECVCPYEKALEAWRKTKEI